MTWPAAEPYTRVLENEPESGVENYSQILDGNWRRISESNSIKLKLAEQLNPYEIPDQYNQTSAF